MNNNTDNLDIVNTKEALNRGNLFDNYFWPYKYVSDIKSYNDRQNLMLKIQEYCFSAHELNLYLDLYPNDTQALGLYNQYKEMADKYTKEYEKKYGPLCPDIDEKSPWNWINSPWPWEKL